MRKRSPVPADDCQTFYIGDTGISEDPLETSLDEYSAEYFGEAAFRRIDDAHCGVENDFGQEVDAPCVSGDKASAINRALHITGDRGCDTVQASDAAVCRAQGGEMSANIRALDVDAAVCRAEGEEGVVAAVLSQSGTDSYRGDIGLKLMHDIGEILGQSGSQSDSKLLHSCYHAVFLKAIFVECARLL